MSSRRLDDWIDSFMLYTENTEPPRTYRLWTAISVVASALQRKCFLEWGRNTVYPNMYIVLVGPSGKARKGTAMSEGLKFLSKIRANVAAEAITREALIRELKNSTATTFSTPDKPTFHCSLTVYSQELAVFLGYNNLTLIADLTDWYDCKDTWTYRTKTAGEDDIIGVWVNLIGATTPDLIQSTMPRDAIGGGLTSRIVFVFEERKGKRVIIPILTKEEKELQEYLHVDLETISGMSGKFSYDESFVRAYAPWYDEENESNPFNSPLFDGYSSRRQVHLLKLSMVMCASRSNKMVITSDDFYRAEETLREVEFKMADVFRGVGHAPHSEVIPKVMSLIAAKGSAKASELLQVFYNDLDKRGLSEVLATLESMKYIRLVYEGNKDLVAEWIGVKK